MGELIGQRTAHLNGRAFASDGGTKQMRHHGAPQHQRRHAQGHHVFGIVNFVDEQVVAGLHVAGLRGLPPLQVQPSHSKTRERQAPDEPAVGLTGLCGPIERKQKERRSRPRQCRHQQRQRRRFDEVAKQRSQRGAIKQVHGCIFAQSPSHSGGLHKCFESGVNGHGGGACCHETAPHVFQFFDGFLQISR